jgi:hypothetical protein
MTATEICATALVESADQMESARNAAAFLKSLSNNNLLWLTLSEIGATDTWTTPSSQDTEFVIDRSSGLGVGVSDSNVAALIAINRRMAREITANSDLPHICSRVQLAFRESGGDVLMPWLLAKMRMKAQLQSVFIERKRLIPSNDRIRVSLVDRTRSTPANVLEITEDPGCLR